MVEFFSNWTKGLSVAIVIVSILEMLLPNNKTKKYIKMVMGIYILFNIINPFVHNKNIFNIDEFNFEDYGTSQAKSTVNQESMDRRIEELCIEELEKDISKKIEKKGYKVNSCKVDAKISEKEDETKIKKIKLNIIKNEEVQKDLMKDVNAQNKNVGNNENNEKSFENKVVVEVQKIKPINILENVGEEKNQKLKKSKSLKLSKAEIRNIKKFLIEEYGVSEKCLEIN